MVSVVRTRMTLLIPAFALGWAPPVLALGLPGPLNAPLPCPALACADAHLRVPLLAAVQDIPSFGEMLEPRYVVGARALDQ